MIQQQNKYAEGIATEDLENLFIGTTSDGARLLSLGGPWREVAKAISESVQNNMLSTIDYRGGGEKLHGNTSYK